MRSKLMRSLLLKRRVPNRSPLRSKWERVEGMRRQTRKFTEVWPSSSQLKLKAVISPLLTLNNWTEKTKSMPENTQDTTTSNNNNTNVVVTIMMIVTTTFVLLLSSSSSSSNSRIHCCGVVNEHL